MSDKNRPWPKVRLNYGGGPPQRSNTSRSMSFDTDADSEGDASRKAEDRRNLQLRLKELRRRIEESEWQDAELITRAGCLCIDLGQREEGMTLLQRALALDRNQAKARARLEEVATKHELWEMNLPQAGDHFTAEPGEFWRYALRGDGPAKIICATLVFGILPVLLKWFYVDPTVVSGGIALVPMVSWLLALSFALLAGSYLLAFLKKVVYTSGAGQEASPSMEVPDLGDLYLGPVRLIALLTPYLGPIMLWDALPRYLMPTWLVLLGSGVTMLAVICVFPMAFLYYSMTGEVFRTYNFKLIFSSMVRVRGDYAKVVLGWMAGAIICFMMILGCQWNVLVCGQLLVLTIMCMIFMGGRALGLLYQSRSEDLGWH